MISLGASVALCFEGRMKLAVTAFALLFTACGGDDFSGIYQVTTALSDGAGCGTGTSSAAPSHVMVQESSFLGQTVLQVKICTSADAASCGESSALVAQGLVQDTGKGGVAFGQTAGTGCEIQGTFVTLVREGDAITIKAERREGTVPGECVASELTDHESELMCKSNQTITANRVGDAPKGADNQIKL